MSDLEDLDHEPEGLHLEEELSAPAGNPGTEAFAPPKSGGSGALLKIVAVLVILGGAGAYACSPVFIMGHRRNAWQRPCRHCLLYRNTPCLQRLSKMQMQLSYPKTKRQPVPTQRSGVLLCRATTRTRCAVAYACCGTVAHQCRRYPHQQPFSAADSERAAACYNISRRNTHA